MKYTNTLGFIIGIIITGIHTMLTNDIGFDNILMLIPAFLGIVFIPAIISGLVSLFYRGKNFGKIFGITCIIFNLLSFFGNNYKA